MSYDFSSLWIEKFRPKTLSDFICTDDVKQLIESFRSKEEIPNLLFIGNPGIGKSSLAKIIVNDILGCQYLYINASDENGIDTIRNKVTHFAQTKSFDGKIKVIILDEFCGVSLEGQRALRNTMEEYAGITRFILTANYKYKVIPAIQSRCQSVDLTPPQDLVVRRCANILKQEGISIEDNQKVSLVKLIKSNYPDLRKCINELQKFSTSGKLNLSSTNNNEVIDLIYSEIKKKNIESLRKALIESEQTFNADYISLLRSLFNYIDSKEANVEMKKMYLLTIAEHLYRSAYVPDQEINCYACLLTLADIKP
jgi:DNA polymerase III delta prime subunit